MGTISPDVRCSAAATACSMRFFSSAVKIFSARILSPAPRGAASAESAATSAKSPAAEAAFPPGPSATETTVPISRAPPSAAPEAGSPCVAATLEDHHENHKERQKKNEQGGEEKVIFRPGPGSCRLRDILAADRFLDRLHSRLNTARVIAGTEAGNDNFTDDPARQRVGENALKAVADLDPKLSVISGDKQDDAIIKALFPYLPGLGHFDAEAFHIFSLKSGNGEHRYLVAGFLFEARQAFFQGDGALGGHQPGQVVNAAA